MIYAPLLIGLALGVAAVAGAFRLGSLNTAPRVPPGRPLWPLLVVFFLGVAIWFAGQIIFVALKQAEMQRGSTQPVTVDPAQFTAEDLAFLSTVPPLCAFLALLLGDLLIEGYVSQRLGVSPRRLPRGVLAGVLAMTVALPLLLGVSMLAEQVYQYVGYQHPPEHDLLRVLRPDNPLVVNVALVLGAVLVAPLFEELLFRGHLQTVLRAAFARIAAGPRLGFEVKVDSSTQAVFVPLEAEPGDGIHPAAASLHGWAAVILASLAFTLVHPRWMWPPLFCLSLCIGWIYERTGSLWASITLHALFNGMSMLWYVHTVQPH